MKAVKLFLCGICLTAASLAQAITVGVFSTGNSQGNTDAVASWIYESGRFSSVLGFDAPSPYALTFDQLNAFDRVLFFTNTDGDSVGNGDVLAKFADTGKRLVVATFSWAQQGGNTLGGRFLDEGYSPFTSFGGTANSPSTMDWNDKTPLFTGVAELSGTLRDRVQASSGFNLNATWSDGYALVASKGNVIGVNLFPGSSSVNPGGDYQQLFVNALAPVPEPESYAMLFSGLLVLGAYARRRERKKSAI